MIYRLFFKLVLQRIDEEWAHTLAAAALRAATFLPPVRAIIARLLRPDPCLTVDVLGTRFQSPLGVAGGLDKDATYFDSLAPLGFGFVEVGTITSLPQPGNPKRRVYRLPEDHAVLNRMGFPNPGAATAAKRLISRRSPLTVVAVSIGLGKDWRGSPSEDYAISARQVAPFVDFLVLNISSPNTPGVRDLQAAEAITDLVAHVRAAQREVRAEVPLLIKISPDLPDAEIDAIADLGVKLGIDGIVAVNTTLDRSGLVSAQTLIAEPGGISGAPLKARALEVLQRLRSRVGDQLVLISVGGIEDAQDAWARIRAGATLVQAHTGFVYGGPLWPSSINRDLAQLTRSAGANSIQELVGTAHRDRRTAPDEIRQHEHDAATSAVPAMSLLSSLPVQPGNAI